jgi:biotin operon repressor
MDSRYLSCILTHRDLTDRSVRIVLLALSFQEQGKRLTQRKLADSLGIGISTVERHFKKLRECGLMTQKRIGSYEWEYAFKCIKPLEAVPSLEETPHINDGSEDAFSGAVESFGGELTPHMGDTSEHILKKEYTICKKEHDDMFYTMDIPKVYPSEGGRMKVIGPKGAFKDNLEAIPLGNKKDRDRAFPRKRVEGKSEAEYNHKDIARVFFQEWRNNRIPGNPVSFVGRDWKHLCELIKEQGPEAIVKYVRWVFTNWVQLKSSYGVTGAPSIPIIYGFRRSWLFEALSDSVPKGKVSGAEFSGGDDIPSGSWE